MAIVCDTPPPPPKSTARPGLRKYTPARKDYIHTFLFWNEFPEKPKVGAGKFLRAISYLSPDQVPLLQATVSAEVDQELVAELDEPLSVAKLEVLS